jgi:polysaccharide biosynthesis transport protein
MKLVDYFNIFLRNLTLIFCTSLAGLFVGLSLAIFTVPVYSATSEIFVSTPVSSLDISGLSLGSSFSQQRVKSYSQLVTNEGTLNPVIQKLDLKISAQDLAKSITADAPLDTVLVRIKVKDNDPTRAATIANEVALQFSVTVNSLEIPALGGDSSVKASLVRSAYPPKFPTSPNKELDILGGILLGFSIGLALGILRKLSDSTVKNEFDLQGTPLLSAVVFDKKAAEFPLISKSGKYSQRTESFRHLRTNLGSLSPDNPPQVIAITSAGPGDGKTTTAINLSITLSEAGYGVLLIDCDLRRPKLHEYLQIDDKSKCHTLTKMITQKLSSSKIQVNKYDFSRERGFSYILAGPIPPNPTDLLSSEKFSSLIQGFRKKWDYIILDTPPVLPVADATVIGQISDGMLIVVRAGFTKISQYQGMVKAISFQGINVLGAIINMIPTRYRGETYGYAYGQYYYGDRAYYSQYDAKNKNLPAEPYAPLWGEFQKEVHIGVENESWDWKLKKKSPIKININRKKNNANKSDLAEKPSAGTDFDAILKRILKEET